MPPEHRVNRCMQGNWVLKRVPSECLLQMCLQDIVCVCGEVITVIILICHLFQVRILKKAHQSESFLLVGSPMHVFSVCNGSFFFLTNI